MITREIFATLADLPLNKAAAAAGVSPAPFKKACRKLGVRRFGRPPQAQSAPLAVTAASFLKLKGNV